MTSKGHTFTFQGSTSFYMKSTNFHLEILDRDNGEISIKMLCLYLVQHMLHQIKACNTFIPI